MNGSSPSAEEEQFENDDERAATAAQIREWAATTLGKGIPT